MDWRRYFKAHILERGLNYYTQDRVSSFEVSSNHLSARVIGTEDYLIEAQLEAEQLIALSCDCPYAAENNFCKHMAAVMYAYENQYDSSINSQAYKSVEDYLLNADENSVRLFLTEILKKDNDLFKQFMVSLGEPITKVDMDRYSNKLRSILSDYLYPDDFIDYEKSWDFSSDLSHYMTKIIEKLLLENGYYEEAFKLSKQVFIELINLPIDDSGGIIMDLAAECSELWEVILDQCAINLKEEMFSWFHSLIENQSTNNKELFPVADELIYNYDFGDNWEVMITKHENYNDLIDNHLVFREELDEIELLVVENHKPYCIYRDGISVMDDVGGLSGYANFLGEKYEQINVDEDVPNINAWATSMGWRPTKTVPKELI